MVDFLFSGFLAGHFGDWLDIPIHGNSLRLVINVDSFLLMAFLLLYFVPAGWSWWNLGRAIKGLETARQQKPDGEIVIKESLQRVFNAKFFASAWNSFRDTLHDMAIKTGKSAWRASAPLSPPKPSSARNRWWTPACMSNSLNTCPASSEPSTA